MSAENLGIGLDFKDSVSGVAALLFYYFYNKCQKQSVLLCKARKYPEKKNESLRPQQPSKAIEKKLILHNFVHFNVSLGFENGWKPTSLAINSQKERKELFHLYRSFGF